MRSRRKRTLRVVYQPGRRDPEGVRKGVDVVERDVALASFDRSDVRAVDLGEVGERLLREAAFQSQLAQASAELSPPPEESRVVAGHAPQTVSPALGG